MLRVEELLGNMTTQVALVMAPLLSWIHTGVANRGGKYAEGGSRGGGQNRETCPCTRQRTLTYFVRGNITEWLTSCLTGLDSAVLLN